MRTRAGWWLGLSLNFPRELAQRMERTDITELLTRTAGGDASARDELWQAVHDYLRDVARRQVGRERGGHTLQPTELVHEAFLRLERAGQACFENRRHFYGAAARAMRQILIDHARGRMPLGDIATIELAGNDSDGFDHDLEALDRALSAMGSEPGLERASRIVELRYFAALTIEETADLLEVSAATIKRDWDYARAWLLRRMRAGRAQ
jgi:RNA polymerase sigma factor (TIGR02999 family)